jgi:hypothetical protein
VFKGNNTPPIRFRSQGAYMRGDAGVFDSHSAQTSFLSA